MKNLKSRNEQQKQYLEKTSRDAKSFKSDKTEVERFS